MAITKSITSHGTEPDSVRARFVCPTCGGRLRATRTKTRFFDIDERGGVAIFLGEDDLGSDWKIDCVAGHGLGRGRGVITEVLRDLLAGVGGN